MAKRDLLTPREAVADGYFSSTKQASRLRAARQGPAYFQLGPRSVRYDRADLDRYLESCRIKVADDLPLRRNLPGTD